VSQARARQARTLTLELVRRLRREHGELRCLAWRPRWHTPTMCFRLIRRDRHLLFAAARYDSFLLMRLACALAMRTSSLVCSKRSAKFPICFATFFRSRLLGLSCRGRRTPSTRGRRARLMAARPASPSAAVPASAPSAPFAIVARPLWDSAVVLSAAAAGSSCCRWEEALDGRRLAAELDPGRLRAALEAFLVAAALALFALELDPERFRAELDAFFVAAALALLEFVRLFEERVELPLGVLEVATGTSRVGYVIRLSRVPRALTAARRWAASLNPLH
jgi:hypothetical protein